MRDTRTVVVKNNKIIHVGRWPGDNLPDGATYENREMKYTPELGWREQDYIQPLTDQERIDLLENTILILLED